MNDEVTHAHEAAHGWFGDGIRLACWEDFVLSEGTVSYLSAHVLGQVAGADAEQMGRIFNLWLKSAEQGDAIAQRVVGDFYLRGVGVEPSRVEAKRWLHFNFSLA